MTSSFSCSPYTLALLLLGFSGSVVAGECEMDETGQALLNSVNEVRSQSRQCGNEAFEAAGKLSWNCKSAEFTEMGAARVEAPGSQYSPFWTQFFARPR